MTGDLIINSGDNVSFLMLTCRPFDAKNPFLSTVRVNKELHKSGDRSCMHIEFDIDGSKMRYDSGKLIGGDGFEYFVIFIEIGYQVMIILSKSGFRIDKIGSKKRI